MPLPAVPAGHTTEENPEAVKVFEELVESKGLDTAGIMAPPHAGNDRGRSLVSSGRRRATLLM